MGDQVVAEALFDDFPATVTFLGGAQRARRKFDERDGGEGAVGGEDDAVVTRDTKASVTRIPLHICIIALTLVHLTKVCLLPRRACKVPKLAKSDQTRL